MPLTLGLSILLAIMETLYVLKKDRLYLIMTKFWGKLFLINFVLGIVTGITLEFQFGTNWAEYSRYVGDIFGAPLPYIACQLGWILAEVGRQPWIVYGILRTSEGVSRSLTPLHVLGSLAGFTLLYGTLAAVDIYLLARAAKKGPEAVAAGNSSHAGEV